VDPNDIKIKSGAIRNYSKEQGSTEIITDYGEQRGRYIKPKCIGTVRARTQTLINQLNSAGLFSTYVINLLLSKIL
jgi:hypothetical protein